MKPIEKINKILSEEYNRGFQEATDFIDEYDVKIALQKTYNKMTGEKLEEDVALEMINAVKRIHMQD